MKNNKKQVVITGVGALSGYGAGKDIFWGNLKNSMPVFKEIRDIRMTPLRSKMGGQITDFKLEEYDPILLRANKFCQYSFATAKKAIEDSKLSFNDDNSYQTGILLGTNFGHPVIQQYADMLNSVKSQYIYPNTATSLIAIKYGIRGIIMNVLSGESSSASAVELALNLIRRGKYHTILVGGAEVLSRMALLYYAQTDEISPGEQGYEERCTPFDKNRTGTILSEGSAFIVMEDREHAQKRGAKVYCEIAGCGASYIPGFSSNNGGSNRIEISMQNAMRDSGLSKSNIELIYGAANGSKRFDKTEMEAIEKTFNGTNNLYVSSIKSIIGETQGASGVFNILTAIFTLQTGMIVPIAHFEKSEHDLNFVKNPIYKKDINLILCNSISYSGGSVSIMVSKFNG